MAKLIIAFNDAETSLSEERKELVREIVEILSLAEKKDIYATKIANDVFLESQEKALKQAQNLFNQLKETYVRDRLAAKPLKVPTKPEDLIN